LLQKVISIDEKLICVSYCLPDYKFQAKKMNVESLRRRINKATSAEIRIAKAAIGICLLFVISWTPYAIIALIGAFGDQ
jgi:hypothetical protein